MGGLPGVWFDKLTRNAGCGRVVGCCWVPAGDAGMTGMCSVGRGNVFSFGANVFSFGPDVFTFRPNVFTLAGQVFSFRWRALVGDRGRRDDGDVSTLSGQCVQFLARCVNFSAKCVHFGEECVQLSAGRPGWGWGADARRDSSFGKLRTGFGGLRTGPFGRLAMNARGVGSQGCGPGFDLTGRG